jgi:LacI family transcriptional regulator
VVEGDFYADSGYRAARDLLALPEAPTAIFAASDMMAAGVLQAAHERGLTVPEDLAVVGFDDIALAALLQPSLTTVRQEKEGLGRAAADGLIRMIEDPAASPARVEVPARLIVRASTAGNNAPRERAHELAKEVERTGDGPSDRRWDVGAALVTDAGNTEEA